MASGTITGSTSNGSISVKIEWTSTLYSSSNTSKVTAKLYYSKSTTEADGTWGSYSGSITINGNTKTISYTISSSDKLSSEDGWVLFGEHTVSPISHNSDGSKSVTISATGGISGTSFTSTSLSGTAKLDTNTQASLPVASVSCSPSSGAIGSSVSITLSNTSSNCEYYLNWATNSDGTGVSTLISGGTYFTSTTWKPTEFQYSITSSGYIVCTTYESGGTEPIGKTYCSFTITKPSVYYIGPPTSITMSNESIIKKGNNISISWSAPSTSGKNNSISGYVVEYGTSTSFGYSQTVTTTSASISTSSFSRGSTIWFRIYTKGSSDSEVSSSESRVYSSNYSVKINSLPSAPSVSFSSYTIPLGGSNPTVTVNAGSDPDGQSCTVSGYNSSTVTTTLSSTKTFYTDDGLETSSGTTVTISKEASPTISLKTTANKVTIGSDSSSYTNKITITATLNKTSGYIKWYLYPDGSSTGVEVGQTSVTSKTATFVFDANSYFRSVGHTFKIKGVFTYIEGYTANATTGTYEMPPALELGSAYNQHDDEDVEGTSGLFYQNIRVYYTYDSEITSMTAACSQTGYPENTFSVGIVSWTPGDSSKNYVDLAMPTNLISGAEYIITINASNGVYNKSASFTKTRMKSADFNNLVVTDGSTTLNPHTNSVLQEDLILSIGHQFGDLSSLDDIPYSEYFLDKDNWWKLKIGYGGNFVELPHAQLSLTHPDNEDITAPNTLYLTVPRSDLFNFDDTNWQNLFGENYDRNYQTTIQFVVTNTYGMSSASIGNIISYIFEEAPVILEDSNISIERRYRLVQDETFDSNIQYYSDVLGTKITNLTGFEEDKYYYVQDPKNTGAIPKGTTLRLQEGMTLNFNPVFNEYNNGDVTVQVQVARRSKQVTTNINSIPESSWINFGESKTVGVNSDQVITTTPIESSTIIEVQIPRIEEELFYYFRIKATDNTGLTNIYYFDHELKTIKHTNGIIAIETAEYNKKDNKLVITISSDLNLGYSEGGEVLKAIVFYSNENASREWVSFPGEDYSISISLEADEDAANLSYQAIKITLDTLVSQTYEDIDFSNVVQFDSGSRTVFSGNVTVAYRKNRLGINTKNIGTNDIITISPTNDRFKVTFLQTEDSDEGSLYLDLNSGIFTGTAKYANQLTNARAINGQSFDGSKNITNFYICQTDANTDVKVLNGFEDFTLQEGSEIVVYFASGNTTSVPSIQNPDKDGSVPIQYRGEAFAKISAGDVLTFRYVSAENSVGDTKVVHYEYVGNFIENTDVKVNQFSKSETGTFPILCSDVSGGANEASGTYYNANAYINLSNGEITAPKFNGQLSGKATSAGTADSAAKTNGTLTIKVNGSNSGTFNGSSDSTINITVPTDYLTSSALNGYVTSTSLSSTLSSYIKTGDTITASKLGTSTIGSSTGPIYLSSGSPKACGWEVEYGSTSTAVSANGGTSSALFYCDNENYGSFVASPRGWDSSITGSWVTVWNSSGYYYILNNTDSDLKFSWIGVKKSGY